MRRVFLDANVLVSTWTLDVLLSLAQKRLFEPTWSALVLVEYVRAANSMGRVENAVNIVESMVKTFPCASVKEWKWRESGIYLPDPNDRHIVAAALEARCDTIVTFNLKDFPQEEMKRLGLRCIHPDTLLSEMVREDPEIVVMVMRKIVTSKKRPPRTMTEEIAGLRRCGLRTFADWLEGQLTD